VGSEAEVGIRLMLGMGKRAEAERDEEGEVVASSFSLISSSEKGKIS